MPVNANSTERPFTAIAEAFEMIIRTHSRTLFAIAYGILQNREEAEDVVQDSLVKAWKMRWRVRDPEKFPAWLSMIARHRAHDVFRKRATASFTHETIAKQAKPIRLIPRRSINNYTQRSLRYRSYIAPRSLSVISKRWIIGRSKTRSALTNGALRGILGRALASLRKQLRPLSLQRTESMATVHDEIDNWLAADLYGELSDEEQRQLHTHPRRLRRVPKSSSGNQNHEQNSGRNSRSAETRSDLRTTNAGRVSKPRPRKNRTAKIAC